MKLFYIRVSTIEQNAERQKIDVIKGTKLFEDKCSGSIPFAERPQGANILKLVTEGKIDTIYVHSIDRLGRNNIDVLNTINFFTENNVNLISNKEGLQTFINGKKNEVASLMIGILSTMAEFELSRIKERQREGIQASKLRGGYVNNGGNKKTETDEEFLNKSKSKKIIKNLNSGYSIRVCAKLSEASVSLVVKVRNLLDERKILTNNEIVESIKKAKTIEKKNKTKLVKERKVKEYVEDYDDIMELGEFFHQQELKQKEE